MVFPVVMYGCESWTIKKAECGRVDAFELWCWRRLGEFLGLQENQISQSKGNQPWIFFGSWSSNALVTWCQELTHLKRPWCLERLKAGGEGHDRGWDGWMASLTQCTWVWASSRRWGRTRKPGVLQCTGSQRVRHNWATEQKQWQCVKHYIIPLKKKQMISLYKV